MDQLPGRICPGLIGARSRCPRLSGRRVASGALAPRPHCSARSGGCPAIVRTCPGTSEFLGRAAGAILWPGRRVPTEARAGDRARAIASRPPAPESSSACRRGSRPGACATSRTAGRITVHPGQCGGRPRVRQTRTRTTDVLNHQATVLPSEKIPEERPDLKREDIVAAIRSTTRRVEHAVFAAGKPGWTPGSLRNPRIVSTGMTPSKRRLSLHRDGKAQGTTKSLKLPGMPARS